MILLKHNIEKCPRRDGEQEKEREERESRFANVFITGDVAKVFCLLLMLILQFHILHRNSFRAIEIIEKRYQNLVVKIVNNI